MSKIWHHLNRTEEQRINADLKRLKLPFRKRIDIVWFILFSSAFTIFILWWLIGVLLGHRFGLFDPPPIQPINDQRILINIHDNINQNPLLDAVYHIPEQALFLSQSGGQLHRYTPTTNLWSTETPFSNTPTLSTLSKPDLSLLRSGCGTDPLSNRTQSCWDNDSLWGLTANQSLVRRKNDSWQIVKGDSLFTGPDNKPVTQGQLTAAAISQDQQWLVVGTQKQSIGIYHLNSRNWLTLPPEFFKQFPSPNITHIAWSLDQFWIGGPNGLTSLSIQDKRPSVTPIPAITGTILDMDVDLTGKLWVLERRNCNTPGSKCIRLSRFTQPSPNFTPEVLVNETNIFPNLSLTDLHFVDYWSSHNRLITAGSAGLFSYDTQSHNWDRHFRGIVQAVLPFPGNADGFYFGYTGGIGVVSGKHRPWRTPNKRSKTWPLPGTNTNEKIIALRHGPKGEVLALGLSGKVFALNENKKTNNVEILFSGTRTTVDPKNFKSAVSFGDTVLFVGNKKAMLHNIKTRTYKDIPLSTLPEWLQRPNLQMISSGNSVYAASQKKGYTHVYRVPFADATIGNFRSATHLAQIPGQVGQLRDWNGRGAGLIASPGKGSAFLFASGKTQLTGYNAPNMDGVPLIDAAKFQNGIIVATEQGLRPYNYLSRGWGGYRRLYSKSSPKEVTECNGRLFMSTLNGRLMELGLNRSFQALIGGKRTFDMSDSQLTDVMVKNNHLYLAGNGWINRYDTDLRSITDRWQLPGKGEIILIDVVGGQPLAISGGAAFFGINKLGPNAGRVLNISTDDSYIWTVRQRSSQGQTGNRYLIRYPIDNPFSPGSQCYFLNPYSGSGTRRVLDAVELTGGNLAVSTDKGLRFYNPSARSWSRRLLGDPVPNGGRLHLLDNHLAIAAQTVNGVNLTVVNLNTLVLPSPCSDNPVMIRNKPQPVRAYAVNPGSREMAYIREDGSIHQWHSQVPLEILPSPGDEPVSQSLKRVFKHSISGFEFLTFTAAYRNAVLHYNLQRRSWLETPLALGLDRGDEIVDINCETGSFQQLITAKTRKGSFYTGAIDTVSPYALANAAKVEMKPLFVPSAGFNRSGDELLDVHQSAGKWWTFVLKDRIKYYDPEKRQWAPDVPIPGSAGSLGFYRWSGRAVLASNQGDTWWVARQRNLRAVSFARYQRTAGETTALSNDGTIWRLLPDGTLFRLKQPDRGNYNNPRIAYETPFFVNSQQVNSAYQWGRRIIFNTPGGLRILDTILRQEMTLPDAAAKVRGINQVLTDGNRAWVLTGSNQLLLLTYHTDRENRLEARLFPGKTAESDLVSRVERLRAAVFTGSPQLPDQWQALKQKLVKLPDGRDVYEPITGLISDNSGQLVVTRPGSQELLAASGTTVIDAQPPPLDVEWLKWNRSSKSFEIKTASPTMLTISAASFVRDGKLLFEDVDALLVTGPNTMTAANRHGIWTYNGGSLDLNDPGITFRPMQWSRPTGAAHGSFITTNNIYKIDASGVPTPQSQPLHRVTFGDVTLIEDMRNTGITGRIKGGKDPFAYKGFNWDKNRRGLAYTANHLVMLSDAGIHPVTGYSGFEAPPVKGLGRIYSRKAGELYFRQGGTWFQRTGPSQWKHNVPDPFATRQNLINNQTWKWHLRNSSLVVQMTGKGYRFKPVWSSRGLSFTSDLLQDAVIFNDQLAVITNAFTEITDYSFPTQLSNFRAARFPLPPVPVDRLQGSRKTNDLVVFSRGRQYKWIDAQKVFDSTPSTPDSSQKGFQAQVPKDSPRLRFTRTVSSTGSRRVKKEIRVNGLQGNEYWVPFNFLNRRFPFDVITSLASSSSSANQELYVGTAAGFQVYTGGLSTFLKDMPNLYQLRSQSKGPLTPIQTVGIPADRTGFIVVKGPGMCVERSIDAPNDPFRQCSQPTSLARRWRYGGKDSFWRFFNRNGKLEGRYRNETGKFSSKPITTITRGRFPHDQLADLTVYNGQVFTLWLNGWISRHDNDSMELKTQGQVINFNTASSRPRRFIEVPRDTRFVTHTAAAGLYFEGMGSRLWKYTGDPSQPWQEIKEPEVVSGLLLHADRPYIVNRNRLRLLAPSRRASPGRRPIFNFEYRAANGQWNPLTWDDDGLTIDRWSQFHYVDGQLWAATPAGLVLFSRTPGQTGSQDPIVLNPDNLMVVPEPVVNKKIPTITDMKVENGIVTIRCDSKSDRVYQGSLGVQTDTNLFTRLQPGTKEAPNDPFLEQLLVPRQESGFWEWVLDGRGDYNPGQLKGKLQGGNIQLVGGRFSFDTINSIAFYKQDQVEIGTDSGGWLQAPYGNLDVPDLQRPKTQGLNSMDVKEVRSSLSPEGETILGLRTSGREFIRVGKEGISGKTRQFPQYLGSDGFWKYMRGDGGSPLSIIAARSSGSSGLIKRQLENGRFTDDIVIGLPVSSTDAEGNHYLLPTKAGVLRLDPSLDPTDIYAQNGLSGAAASTSPTTPEIVPGVLYIDSRTNPMRPLYLEGGQFRPIAAASGPGTGASTDSFSANAPIDSEVLAVEDGPQDFVRVRWRDGNRRGWTLVHPGDDTRVEEADSLYVNLSQFDKFISNRKKWGATQPWMRVRLRPGNVEFLIHGSNRPFQMNLPAPTDVLAALVNGESLLLIGKTKLWDINLEYAMEQGVENRE